MFYIILIILAITLYIGVKKVFFTSKKIETSYIIKEKVEEVDELFDEIVDVKYQLNINLIKLNLYNIDNIKNYRLQNLYRLIIIQNFNLEEPFHIVFFKLLLFVDQDIFWIKSHKSKELKMRVRDKNNTLQSVTSVIVFSVVNLIVDVLSRINKLVYRKLNKRNTQLLLLATMIFIIEKSENFKDIFSLKNMDENTRFTYLIDMFFFNFSDEYRVELNPMTNINHKLILAIYLENIETAREFPNIIDSSLDKPQSDNLLNHIQKKQLTNKYDF